MKAARKILAIALALMLALSSMAVFAEEGENDEAAPLSALSVDNGIMTIADPQQPTGTPEGAEPTDTPTAAPTAPTAAPDPTEGPTSDPNVQGNMHDPDHCEHQGDVGEDAHVFSTDKVHYAAKTDHGGHIIRHVDAVKCGDSSYDVYACEVCNTEFKVNEVVKEHTGDTLVGHVNATCTEDGYEEYYPCGVCGKSWRKTLSRSGHDFEAYEDEDGNPIVVDPTCTEQGYTKKHCVNRWTNQAGETVHCSEVRIDDVVPAKGHDWAIDEYAKVDSTCVEEGKEGAMWVCNRCGLIDNEDGKISGKGSVANYDKGDGTRYVPAHIIEKKNHESHIPTHYIYAKDTDLVSGQTGFTDYDLDNLSSLQCSPLVVPYDLNGVEYTVGSDHFIRVNGERVLIGISGNDGQPILFPHMIDGTGELDGFEDTHGHDAYCTVKYTYTPRKCDEDGSFTWTCTECGKSSTVTIKATGHVMVPVDNRQNKNSCTEPDERKFECKVPGCNYTETRTIPARGYHVFDENDDPKGVVYKQQKAKDIEPVQYAAWYGPSVADSDGNIGPYKPDKHLATCYDYQKIVHCNNPDCDYTKTIEVKGTDDHVYSTDYNVIKAATCTEEGVRMWYCEACGYYATSVIPKLAHNTQWVVTTPATCEEEGVQKLTCKTCGAVVNTQRIPAIGHNIITVREKGSTCTEDGEIVEQCTRCNKTWTTVIPGHHYYDLTDPNSYNTRTYKAPTCTAAGYIEFDCKVCHALNVEYNIPKLGHTRDRDNFDASHKLSYGGKWYDKYEPATCLARAYYYYKCPDCGYEDKVEVGELAPHEEYARKNDADYKGFVMKTWPSCEAPGVGTYECTKCHKWVDVTISQLPHNWVTTWNSILNTYETKCEPVDVLGGHIEGSSYGIQDATELYHYEEILKHLVSTDDCGANDAVYFKLTHKLSGDDADYVARIGCGTKMDVKPVPPEYTVTPTKTSNGRNAVQVKLKTDSLPLDQKVFFVHVTWIVETPQGSTMTFINVFDVDADGIAKIGTVDTKGGKLQRVIAIVVNRDDLDGKDPAEITERFGFGSW